MIVRILGLEQAIQHMDPAHVEQPLRRFSRGRNLYSGRARINALVFRGQLRNAIVYEVRPRAARCGVLRGAFQRPGQKAFGMEYGTGALSDAGRARVTHLPTAGELDVGQAARF